MNLKLSSAASIAFILISSKLCGQINTNKIFLDQYQTTTDSTNASYYKLIEYISEDSLKTKVMLFSIDGILKSIEQYSNYKKKTKEGKSYTYHSDLKLKSIADFKDGKYHDTLKTFHSNGTIKRLEIFEDGKTVKGNCYGINGNDTLYFPYETIGRYPGGEDALIKYLVKNIKYPEKARKKGIEGTVYIKFLVNKNGDIENLKVAKSVDLFLDTEAMRVVAQMGKWIPGEIDGEKIALFYTLPIKFKLQ